MQRPDRYHGDVDLSAASPARSPRQPLVEPGAIEHHVADLSMTAAADVTLSALQAKLAEAGQWLPIDGDPTLPLGELVAMNSTGPLRLGYGAWRDLLLGCQFENPRGQLITAGGRTVKNVAGYDLTKLLVGQGGQLGRLVTITTRTYRRPAAALVARFAPGRELVNLLLPSPLRPQWMLKTRDSILCGYLGDERTIAYYQRELPRIEPLAIEPRTVEADSAQRQALWRWPMDGPGARLSVPPAQVDTLLDGPLAGLDVIADPAFGILLVRGIDLAAAGALNLRGVWSDGRGIEPLGQTELEREIVQRLKQTL